MEALHANVEPGAAVAARVVMSLLGSERPEAAAPTVFRQWGHAGQVLWFSCERDQWIFKDALQAVVARIHQDPDCPACSARRERRGTSTMRVEP